MREWPQILQNSVLDVYIFNAKKVKLILFFPLTDDGNLKDGVTYQQMQVSFSEKILRIVLN